ncbi:hypothetical protein O6H91_14G031200 [Diphasiastrum complanatum]|uniref:Uncharacterized protein n=1 Tax=Diphasiastrum complanatum TaxID=34168 RepID=A0ACC2BMU1_DIPCM|nr:hypothetical protein O6H91_14G031200 [Diphasiastrum complanatum]
MSKRERDREFMMPLCWVSQYHWAVIRGKYGRSFWQRVLSIWARQSMSLILKTSLFLRIIVGALFKRLQLLELEVLRTLRDKCFEQRRPVTLAFEAFPCTLQTQLNKYMSKRLTDDELKALVTSWPTGRWQEYEPILHYCRDNGVRLMACGTPPEILLAVQAKGVQGLSDAEKRKFIPPTDSFGDNSFQLIQKLALTNLLPMVSFSFGPGPYQFAQAHIVSDYVMAQVVTQAMTDGGAVGSLVVITGASHVKYGSRGVGLPARIAKKLQKKTQIVILLNPERQHIRKEGELPEADLLWYSAAKPCVRNCFDRAEVARVMGAAGQSRDALPQDIQAGLERGIVSPEVLKSFFELDRQPLLAELTRRFQGLRERWLADPRFLQRLAIEEAISITTTLMAQYERRKDRFWKELDYVITDTVRASVVDFFTVWLPAPRLAFRPLGTDNTVQGALEGLKGLLGSLPDNAFQRAQAGEHWDLRARIGTVIFGGGKLFFVGFISSLGTLSMTNALLFLRQYFSPQPASKPSNKRSPILKTAFVYAAFLGTSANLRYQAIAGLVEHWVADYFLASEPLAGNLISFVARTANSYWGTTQWIDLARITGLQAHQSEPSETVLQDRSKDSEPKTCSDPVNLNSSWKPPASMGDVESGSVESQVFKKGTIEKSGVEGEKL